MTTDLTLNVEKEDFKRLEKEFFDISLRKSKENMYERAERVMDYFKNLEKEEQEVIKDKFKNVINYLKDIREYFKI